MLDTLAFSHSLDCSVSCFVPRPGRIFIVALSCAVRSPYRALQVFRDKAPVPETHEQLGLHGHAAATSVAVVDVGPRETREHALGIARGRHGYGLLVGVVVRQGLSVTTPPFWLGHG